MSNQVGRNRRRLVRNMRGIGADNYTTTRLALRYQARRSQLYKHTQYTEVHYVL